MRKIFAIVLMFLALLSITAPVLACEPPPTKPPTPKYLDCDDLGNDYQFGFRISGARNGTYHLTDRDGRLTGGAPDDSRNGVRISDSNGRSFDWEASLGIDAVIVNAGGKSTVKKLNEQKEGNNFYGRVGYDRRPYKIDAISFCYDYELSLSTSAEGTSTSTGEWGITKTVDTAVQSKLAGETADYLYTVAVNGTAGSETGFKVKTVLVIKNDTPVKASIRSIKDYLSPWKKWVELDCGDIRLPYTLKPGKELTCTAEVSVDSKRDGENKAGVVSYGVHGGYTEADIVWTGGSSGGGAPVGAVTVTDTNAAFGGPYTVEAANSWTYTVSLACPTDPAVYVNGVYTTTLDNTATIVETSLQASQSVALNCYAPTTSLSSNATYDAKYNWGITKTSPVSELKLNQGEEAMIDYDVVVSVIDRIESNFSLSGAIVVSNPHPTAAMTVTLAGEVAPGNPAVLTDCTNPLTIPAGQSLTCQYTAASATDLEGGSTVQVTLNNIVFSNLTPFDFTNAVVNEIDECVTVFDDAFEDPMDTACVSDAPASFLYDVTVGPFEDCSDTDYTNTAYFITNDTGASDYANWQVLIDVVCPVLTNCTYNATYWIAHANQTPDTYDATWDQVGGPSAPFYTTGTTWIGALETDPGTSVYRGLARIYIVGKLNVLRGAQSSGPLDATLDHAASLLETYGATQDAITDEAVVRDFSNTASVIDNFNRGFTGPGLCPDCTAE